MSARVQPVRVSAALTSFVRRDAQLAHLTHFHAETALIPPRDHAANPRIVLEWLLARVLCRPEFLSSLLDDTGRMHLDARALGDGRLAGAGLDDVEGRVEARELHEARGGRDEGEEKRRHHGLLDVAVV